MNDKSEASLSHWLAQIEQVCTSLNIFTVSVIVDQAGDVPSLVQDLLRFKPEIDWVSLLENEPENEFIDDAPLFLQLRIDIWQHKEWLAALLRQYHDPARILLFFSHSDYGLLARHLQGLTTAEWEGRKGMMRYYDTRIFPFLVDAILIKWQKEYFLGIAKFWSWRDRDGQPVWLSGGEQEYDFSEPAMITLTDAQYSQLGIISDIERFVSHHYYKYPEYTRESLFDHLWHVLQNASAKNIVDNERFLIDYMTKAEV